MPGAGRVAGGLNEGGAMSFNLKVSSGVGGDKERCPAGNHPAVLVALIDMGQQHHEYMGTANWRRDCFLCWQVPGKKTAKGEPHLVTAQVTLSLNEKATLRKWIEGMKGGKLGDNFDVSSLLGAACMLNVVHSEKGYPRVQGVAAYPEGLPEPKATLAPFACTLDEFKAGKEFPEWLPWAWLSAIDPPAMKPIAEHVALCKEIAGDGTHRKALAGAGAATGPLGDNDPF